MTYYRKHLAHQIIPKATGQSASCSPCTRCKKNHCDWINNKLKQPRQNPTKAIKKTLPVQPRGGSCGCDDGGIDVHVASHATQEGSRRRKRPLQSILARSGASRNSLQITCTRSREEWVKSACGERIPVSRWVDMGASGLVSHLGATCKSERSFAREAAAEVARRGQIPG